MTIRQALTTDIPQMQTVRNAVKENALSNPYLITDNDYKNYITNRGKGWVCEIGNNIVGFSIADVKGNNVWALFVHPEFDKQGIGRQLHDIMLNWYFTQTQTTIWLSTASHTRAERFYRKSGWLETGTHGKREIKFEMTFDNWLQQASSLSIQSFQ